MSLGYNVSSFVRDFDQSYLEALASPHMTIEEKGKLIAKARSCHPQIQEEEDKIVYTFDVSHFETLEVGIKFLGTRKFSLEGHHTLANGIHRDVEHVFDLPPTADRHGCKQRRLNGTLTVEFPKVQPKEESGAKEGDESGTATENERKRKHSPLE